MSDWAKFTITGNTPIAPVHISPATIAAIKGTTAHTTPDGWIMAPSGKSGDVGVPPLGPQPCAPAPRALTMEDQAIHRAIAQMRTEPHGNRMGAAQWIEEEP